MTEGIHDHAENANAARAAIGVTTEREHCQNGASDVCIFGTIGGTRCPAEYCGINDGIRQAPAQVEITELIQAVEDAFFCSHPPGTEDADNWSKLKSMIAVISNAQNTRGKPLRRQAFERLIAENMVWLRKQSRCLERNHILDLLADAPKMYYGDTSNTDGVVVDMEELRWMHDELKSAFKVAEKDAFPAHWPMLDEANERLSRIEALLSDKGEGG